MIEHPWCAANNNVRRLRNAHLIMSFLLSPNGETG